MIPSAIVVDFEPHLARDGIAHNSRMWPELADLGECLELAWTAKDAGAFASMAMGRALPSYRERSEVRDNIMAAFRGETPGMAAWLEMAARNKGMNRGALAMTRTSGGQTFEVERWGNPTPEPWKPDPVNDRYARKFLKLALEYKIPVYCLLMPVVPAVQAKYESSGMDRRHADWLGRLQARYSNLYVLDWRHSNYREPAFHDALHLNSDGALSITSALGDYLKGCFQGRGVDVRWVRMPDFRLDGVEIAVEDSNRSDAFMRSTASRRR